MTTAEHTTLRDLVLHYAERRGWRTQRRIAVTVGIDETAFSRFLDGKQDLGAVTTFEILQAISLPVSEYPRAFQLLARAQDESRLFASQRTQRRTARPEAVAGASLPPAPVSAAPASAYPRSAGEQPAAYSPPPLPERAPVGVGGGALVKLALPLALVVAAMGGVLYLFGLRWTLLLAISALILVGLILVVSRRRHRSQARASARLPGVPAAPASWQPAPPPPFAPPPPLPPVPPVQPPSSLELRVRALKQEYGVLPGEPVPAGALAELFQEERFSGEQIIMFYRAFLAS